MSNGEKGCGIAPSPQTRGDEDTLAKDSMPSLTMRTIDGVGWDGTGGVT